MTKEKLLEVIRLYNALLSAFPPEEMTQYDEAPKSDNVWFRHLRWMLAEMPGQVAQGDLDKAFRWLGFIQGILAAKELRTIDQLREDSRSTK